MNKSINKGNLLMGKESTGIVLEFIAIYYNKQE